MKKYWKISVLLFVLLVFFVSPGCTKGSGNVKIEKSSNDVAEILKKETETASDVSSEQKSEEKNQPEDDPLPGAKDFLDELRSITQVLILSDTFEQFATPLMKKLGWPTLMCNSLTVGADGMITGYKMRCAQSKLTTVKALQSIGYETIAAGDSFNDLAMIEAGKTGFLFRTTDKIREDHPDLAAFEEYDELLDAIRKAL